MPLLILSSPNHDPRAGEDAVHYSHGESAAIVDCCCNEVKRKCASDA